MRFVCWVLTVLSARAGPMVWPRSDAVPTYREDCAYWASNRHLVSFCSPKYQKEKLEISRHSSLAETPTGLLGNLARRSWIKVKTALKCWFGTVSTQRQQETSRHLICALAMTLLVLLHLFGCWYALGSLLSRRGLVMCLWASHLEDNTVFFFMAKGRADRVLLQG